MDARSADRWGNLVQKIEIFPKELQARVTALLSKPGGLMTMKEVDFCDDVHALYLLVTDWQKERKAFSEDPVLTNDVIDSIIERFTGILSTETLGFGVVWMMINYVREKQQLDKSHPGAKNLLRSQIMGAIAGCRLATTVNYRIMDHQFVTHMWQTWKQVCNLHKADQPCMLSMVELADAVRALVQDFCDEKDVTLRTILMIQYFKSKHLYDELDTCYKHRADLVLGAMHDSEHYAAAHEYLNDILDDPVRYLAEFNSPC